MARLRTGQLTLDDAPTIKHDPHRTDFPLSIRQREAYAFECLHPRSAANTIFFCVRIRGPLDEAALRAALDAIVDRHATLRTVIRGTPGDERQVVLPSIETPLAIVDLTHLSPDAAQREALRRAQQVVDDGFDLWHGPLARAVLLRTESASRILVLQIHHIIADGWSLGVALFELNAVYAGLVAGERPALAELPIQYGDFCVWEHEWVRRQDFTSLREYWAPRLRPAAPLNLGYAYPAADRQDVEGASVEMALPEATTADIRRVSRECGVTTFMFLAAGVAAVCHSLTGANAISIESPLANRVRPETLGLIGLFVNELPLRIDVSGDPTFQELLGRVHGVCAKAHAAQHVPLEALLERFGIEHRSDGTAIAQVELVLHNWPLPALTLGETELEPFELKTTHSFCDFEFHLWDGRPAIEGRVGYKTALYDEASIRQKLHMLQRFLRVAALDPARRLSELISA